MIRVIYYWDEWELFNPPGAIRPDSNAYQDPINWDDFLEGMNFDDEEDDSDE